MNKTITIQWRKVWPKGRTFQKRILGNGVQLADKLASILPNNYLIRLVDTASLSFIEQVSIMRTSDYYKKSLKELFLIFYKYFFIFKAVKL